MGTHSQLTERNIINSLDSSVTSLNVRPELMVIEYRIEPGTL